MKTIRQEATKVFGGQSSLSSFASTTNASILGYVHYGIFPAKTAAATRSTAHVLDRRDVEKIGLFLLSKDARSGPDSTPYGRRLALGLSPPGHDRIHQMYTANLPSNGGLNDLVLAYSFRPIGTF